MVTVKLLSIHADNEQTLDERNTLLTVRARQAGRLGAGFQRGTPRDCSVPSGKEPGRLCRCQHASYPDCSAPTPLGRRTRLPWPSTPSLWSAWQVSHMCSHE